MKKYVFVHNYGFAYVYENGILSWTSLRFEGPDSFYDVIRFLEEEGAVEPGFWVERRFELEGVSSTHNGHVAELNEALKGKVSIDCYVFVDDVPELDVSQYGNMPDFIEMMKKDFVGSYANAKRDHHEYLEEELEKFIKRNSDYVFYSPQK